MQAMQYFVRHGSTALNSSNRADDRLRGWFDVPLSLDGVREACDTARSLVGCGAGLVVSSDLLRAKYTANVIAATLGVEVHLDFGLRPWNVGEAAGRRSEEVHAMLESYARERPDDPVPGGEPFAAFLARCTASLEYLLAYDETIVAVVHYRVLAVLQHLLVGTDSLFAGVRVPEPGGSLRVQGRRLL